MTPQTLPALREALPPGSTIGIVGGGQLGRMLAQTAHQHGYRVAVLTGGSRNTPAGSVADTEIAAPFDDDAAISRLLEVADVITWEFENVDLRVARAAQRAGVGVFPSAEIIATTQDRSLEKKALQEIGVSVAPWCIVNRQDELAAAVREFGLPVIAKAARFGYDGKGQTRIETHNAVADAWQRLGCQRLVVESVVAFEREISVVVARSMDGQVADHGCMENAHVKHVLDSTITPARISEARSREARGIAAHIANQWGLVGVLCVEMFDTPTGLVVNEVAPRPHNSGHCTIEAAAASQFEQQLRAVVGMPLGDGRCQPAAMLQLLGDLFLEGALDWSEIYAAAAVHLHLYGKQEARSGRKMGHLTLVGDDSVGADPAVLLAKLMSLRQALTDR
ncbi:MAG: 5-(carboxyamino)imidazole ribonucleotide synthase [Acidimicrobiia bacterium]|nr:5-(carboxyamino)imidazole ribonucleotide synthase [Acidimicrobiia bacterium]